MYFDAVFFATAFMPRFVTLINFLKNFEILSFVAAAEFLIEKLVLKPFLLFGVWLQKEVWLDLFEIHFVPIIMRFGTTVNVVF